MNGREGSVALIDIGSTYTKVRLVGRSGELEAASQHRTTIDTDVHVGIAEALRLAERESGATVIRSDACSSAGGGLRMAVVGLVDELTAEAARRAALGAGARVLGVVSGGLTPARARELIESSPDIVMLVGGTDGGDRQTLRSSAAALADAKPPMPVVVAGNVEAQPDAVRALADVGVNVVTAPNVMPAIDTLATEPAREVIRQLFIDHVIGGKLKGFDDDIAGLVRMATPDAALAGVEALAEALRRDGGAAGVIVVDIGGATTDVHSWAPQTQRPGVKSSLLPQEPSARTVEADLGMRWNAPGIVEAGVAEGLIDPEGVDGLAVAAEVRAADPSFLPATEEEAEVDRMLARVAIAVALRRHAGERQITLTPEGAVVRRDGRDLSDAGSLIGTGGVFRNLGAADVESALARAHEDRKPRLLPAAPRIGVDRRGCIAAAGLLADTDPEIAGRFLGRQIRSLFSEVEKGTNDVLTAS